MTCIESGNRTVGTKEVPLVSVVIPCFNAAAFVSQAVDSVLEQARDDIQIVVVNDGSPDSPELERTLVHYGDDIELVNQPHCGLSAARNRGIAVARGTYLAFLDADDIWKSGMLQRQLDMLHTTGADLVYCDAELFGGSVEPGSTIMNQYPSRGAVTAESLLMKECLVVMSTVVVRAAAVRSAGGFDQTLNACEDLDLWLRMLIAGASFSYHKESLTRRRIHPANMSADSVLMANGALEIIRRYTPVVSLSKVQRRTLDKRVQRLKGSLHETLARRAIRENNAIGVRRELWRAFCIEKKVRHLAGVLAFTFLPRLAIRLLYERS